MKRMGVFLVVVMLGLTLQSFAADLVKVGFVDVQKVLETCTEGKEARKKLDQMVKAREEVLKPEKDAIDALKKELDEQVLLRDEVKRQKMADLQDKARAFDDKRQRALEEVKKEEQKYTQPILEKIDKFINNIGTEEGYTIIFEKNYSSLIYASEQINLTDTLIRKLDEKYNQ